MNKYPEYIMRDVRCNLGLKNTDTSRDNEINNMSHNEIFNRCLVWECIIGYEEILRTMVEDIYGVELR